MIVTIERFLAIVGLCISIAGIIVIASSSVAGLVLLASGLAFFIYNFWAIFLRPELVTDYVSYRFVLCNPEGSLAEVIRSTQITFYIRNCSTLIARDLDTTGQFGAFNSNIGHIEEGTKTIQGGTTTINAELSRPFEYKKPISWVLKYSTINAFLDNTESVLLKGSPKMRVGILEVVFHQDRIPKNLRKVVYRQGKIKVIEENVQVKEKVPYAVWVIFKPRIDTDYLLEWDWK